MAYASSYLTDEEKKKADAQAGVNTSGVIEGTAGAGTSAGMAEQQAKAPGTGFVNLQQYLDMNKGAGAGIAGKVTEDVNKAADTYSTTAQQKLEQGKEKFSEASKSGQASQIRSSIVSDADQNKQAAQDFLGAGYAGPRATDLAAPLAADRTKLQSDLSKVGDLEQQQANLQKAYGGTGNYSSGYGLLDSFILQGDQSGRDKINQVKGRAAEVGSTFDTTSSKLKAEEEAARNALAENKRSIVSTADQERARIENEANRKAQRINLEIAQQKREGAKNASIADALDDNQLSDLRALAELSNANTDYFRTLDRGQAKAQPAAPQVSRDEGFVFTPTGDGKRYDADGREIPPEDGGIAQQDKFNNQQNIPVRTDSTWQAMPRTPVAPVDTGPFTFTPTGPRFDASGKEIPAAAAPPLRKPAAKAPAAGIKKDKKKESVK